MGMPLSNVYGPLVKDENGLLDFPEGFSYTVISELDTIMDDGFSMPNNADGMGCIALDEKCVVLVHNYDLTQKYLASVTALIQNHLYVF